MAGYRGLVRKKLLKLPWLMTPKPLRPAAPPPTARVTADVPFDPGPYAGVAVRPERVGYRLEAVRVTSHR